LKVPTNIFDSRKSGLLKDIRS